MSKKSSKRSKQSGNTKQIAPAKRWCFTLNNPTTEEITEMKVLFEIQEDKYVLGTEIGESGTPHIQGYVHFASKCRPLSLKLSSRIHWEKCKGTEKQNIDYCTKDGDYTSNFKIPRKPRVITEKQLYPWQEHLVQMCQKIPDERHIYWYWEPNGKVGKTALTRYLMKHHGAMLVNGCSKDILYATSEVDTDIYIFHFVRSKEQYISYEAIECVKDATYFSGKYESKMILRDFPHVIIFANFEPDKEKLSKDRWKIIRIRETKKNIIDKLVDLEEGSEESEWEDE